MAHVPLETLHALGILPERCIDCDSRRCPTPGQCMVETAEQFDARVNSSEAIAARGGQSWEAWMSS